MTMTEYKRVRQELKSNPQTWLITGVAGFIGSNLLQTLLSLDQEVIGLDNLAVGHRRNLDAVRRLITTVQWKKFRFIEGDICDLNTCYRACDGADYVLHHAALGSVPRSIEDPLAANRNNIDGFLNVLVAARAANVKRFVYATSSSVYGDNPELPKVEHNVGRPLSPYAVTKLTNEIYAEVFATTYGFESIGLRYFNIFGQRQDPAGDYAAVIPRWITAMINNQPIVINGDGETTRDFCYVDNAVQANLLAALVSNAAANGEVYNVAVGDQTSLNQLFSHLRELLTKKFPNLNIENPIYGDFRAGDLRRSFADIRKAQSILGYLPTHSVTKGLSDAIDWYISLQS